MRRASGNWPARVCRALCALFTVSAAVSAAAQSPAQPEGWVVLPIDEYRALRDRAVPPAPPPVAPPVDATLTRVDYELALDTDAVTGRALLAIDVLRDGWTRVQIPSGLMVRAARLDGEQVAFVEGPPAHILVSRAGRFVLALDIVVPLASAGGAESITLPPSQAPISRVTLTLPRADVDLTSSAGFVSDRAETATETRWTTFGRPNAPLTLSWKRKVDDRRAEQPLRLRARVIQVVGLGEDASQVTAAVRVEVVQGLAREIELTLPASLSVNQVNGATIGDWSARGTTLAVRLLEPTAADFSFVVQADARIPRDGSVAVPIVRVPAAERETGGVAVDVAGAGEIGERLAHGLDPADPTDLGEPATARQSPSMVAFRFRPQPGAEERSLTVSVVRYTPHAVLVANVEEARYRALASADGQLLVEARYGVRNNQRSFLKVTLPAGATVWSAQVGGRPIRPGVAEEGAVLLPLDKGRAGEDAPAFVVELTYIQPIAPWSDKGNARLELPALDLPVSRTGVQLHFPPGFRVEPQPGSFRLEPDAGPFVEVLRRPVRAVPAARPEGDAAAAGLQSLVERFKSEAGGRSVAGALPVKVVFPAFGPSLFLASELTAESHMSSLELAFKRTRK
jgi:hypothetical protein